MKPIKIVFFLVLILILFAYSGVREPKDVRLINEVNTIHEPFNSALDKNEAIFDQKLDELNNSIARLDSVLEVTESRR